MLLSRHPGANEGPKQGFKLGSEEYLLLQVQNEAAWPSSLPNIVDDANFAA